MEGVEEEEHSGRYERVGRRTTVAVVRGWRRRTTVAVKRE
jgi:hypothetical protein